MMHNCAQRQGNASEAAREIPIAVRVDEKQQNLAVLTETRGTEEQIPF